MSIFFLHYTVSGSASAYPRTTDLFKTECSLAKAPGNSQKKRREKKFLLDDKSCEYIFKRLEHSRFEELQHFLSDGRVYR